MTAGAGRLLLALAAAAEATWIVFLSWLAWRG